MLKAKASKRKQSAKTAKKQKNTGKKDRHVHKSAARLQHSLQLAAVSGPSFTAAQWHAYSACSPSALMIGHHLAVSDL